MHCVHDRLQKDFQVHQLVSTALKHPITENIDKMFPADIKVSEKSVLKVMNYVQQRYFKITTEKIYATKKTSENCGMSKNPSRYTSKE